MQARKETLMLSTFTDHPTFTALIGAVAALILKLIYDKWFSKTSRVSMELFLKNNELINQRFEAILANCRNTQKTCSEKLMEKICEQQERLNLGDDTFRSNGHVQRAILITLLEMCKHQGVDCDTLTKVFVDKDLLI